MSQETTSQQRQMLRGTAWLTAGSISRLLRICLYYSLVCLDELHGAGEANRSFHHRLQHLILGFTDFNESWNSGGCGQAGG